jgi:hypothetical protein
MLPFIPFEPASVATALGAWAWIGVAGKAPVRLTAFGQVFLQDAEGIWFLDTIDGKLTRVCAGEAELETLLQDPDAREHYLLESFLERVAATGRTLRPGQVFDFIVNPVIGGRMELANVRATDLMVSIHMAGQIHDQVRSLPPGTKIDRVDIRDTSDEDEGEEADEGVARKPWWKFW